MIYTCCFAFNPSITSILLIKKAKPDWQKGFLNGIGGKVEPNETVMYATLRKFQEETCLTDRSLEDFKPHIFHAMMWREYKTHTNWPLVYFSAGILSDEKMDEAERDTQSFDEPCVVANLRQLHRAGPLMPNLPFLISMAEYMVCCSPDERKLRQPVVLTPECYAGILKFEKANFSFIGDWNA